MMYSNMNGELKTGESMSSHAQLASPSGLGSETTMQHSQSMDSVNTAGEEEVSLVICLSVCLFLYARSMYVFGQT